MTVCGHPTLAGPCALDGIAWGPRKRCYWHWSVEDPSAARPVATLEPTSAHLLFVRIHSLEDERELERIGRVIGEDVRTDAQTIAGVGGHLYVEVDG
jgi:hypothetical protein